MTDGFSALTWLLVWTLHAINCCTLPIWETQSSNWLHVTCWVWCEQSVVQPWLGTMCFTTLLCQCLVGGLLACWLGYLLWIERSGLEHWPGAWCSVLGQDTWLSQSLSPHTCINEWDTPSPFILLKLERQYDGPFGLYVVCRPFTPIWNGLVTTIPLMGSGNTATLVAFMPQKPV